MDDRKLFDISRAKVGITRTRDTKRATVTIHDPSGLPDLKVYMLLALELEKIERALGITKASDERH